MIRHTTKFNLKFLSVMADEMTPVKVYTDGRNNDVLTAALMSRNNGGWFGGDGGGDLAALLVGGIIGAGMSGNGLFGNNGNNNAVNQQLASLQAQISDNANHAASMDAIGSLAAANGAGMAGINATLGALGTSFQQGCCDCKTAILESGFENRLANCNQTNTILQQSQGLQNTMQQLGMTLGFQAERDACAIKETSTANTQRIIDTLNNHWSLEQQTTIQQLRDEIGRLNQTNQLIAALGGAAAARVTSAGASA